MSRGPGSAENIKWWINRSGWSAFFDLREFWAKAKCVTSRGMNETTEEIFPLRSR